MVCSCMLYMFYLTMLIICWWLPFLKWLEHAFRRSVIYSLFGGFGKASEDRGVGKVVVGTETDRCRKQWIRRRGLWLVDVV